jgi:hypothetical protein
MSCREQQSQLVERLLLALAGRCLARNEDLMDLYLLLDVHGGHVAFRQVGGALPVFPLLRSPLSPPSARPSCRSS